MALYGRFVYSSMLSDLSGPGVDLQIYGAGVGLVVHPRLAVFGQYSAREQDSLSHDITGALRYYFRSPAEFREEINPDGPLLAPVVTVGGGVRLYAESVTRSAGLAQIDMALPISSRLTIAAGYRYYEVKETVDALVGFGTVRLYFGQYAADSAWVNPDGPVGAPVISFTGGGSSDGPAFEVGVLAPISPGMTLGLTAGYQRLSDPRLHVLSGRLGLSLYASH